MKKPVPGCCCCLENLYADQIVKLMKNKTMQQMSKTVLKNLQQKFSMINITTLKKNKTDVGKDFRCQYFREDALMPKGSFQDQLLMINSGPGECTAILQ